MVGQKVSHRKTSNYFLVSQLSINPVYLTIKELSCAHSACCIKAYFTSHFIIRQ